MKTNQSQSKPIRIYVRDKVKKSSIYKDLTSLRTVFQRGSIPLLAVDC